MKALFIKFKPVVRFITTFLLVYFALSVAYKFYLEYSKTSTYYPDYFTHLVAQQTKGLLNAFSYTTETLPHENEPSIKLIVNGNYLARVIEGCNGISIIILFVAFIVAFASRLKPTLLYVLAGSVLIYSINLARIVLLSIGLYHYPELEVVLHTVIFPALIYGVVFLLWVFWVNTFSKLKPKHA